MTAHCRPDHWYPTERDMREAVEIWDIAHDASIPIMTAVRDIADRLKALRNSASSPLLPPASPGDGEGESPSRSMKAGRGTGL